MRRIFSPAIRSNRANIFADDGATGRLRHQSSVFLITNHPRNRVADFLKAGKIPEIRKIAALLRLHRLHGTIIAIQKNALAIWFFLQRQSAPVRTQTHVPLNEFVFAQLKKRREPGDFFICQANLSRPATTRRAALTFIKNRHAADYWIIRLWPSIARRRK